MHKGISWASHSIVDTTIKFVHILFMHTLHKPHKNHQQRHSPFFCPIALALFLVVMAPGVALSGEPGFNGIKWQQAPTCHTMILFQTVEDLENLNRRIDFSVPEIKENTSDTVLTVSRKVDALFQRARQLLGMQCFVNRVNIRVYRNREQLDRAFFDLYQTQSHARAWYAHEKLTVYIQLEDFHEGMLAHELAHAIIDHYLIIPPPPETAEILARYVDTHLKEAGNMQARNSGAGPVHAQGYSSD